MTTLGASVATPRENLVELHAVHKSYGVGPLAAKVLHGISLQIRAGELTLVMGPSGSGKTTLLSIAAGLIAPSSGVVRLCGATLSDTSPAAAAAVRREHVGFVFQSYHLFEAVSARQNVAAVLRLKGHSKKEALRRADEELERVGLAGRTGHRPSALSGGQQQRVAIARALAADPSIIIGDEITAALDGHTAFEVMELLDGFVNRATGVVLVTHDKRLERFADRVLEIEDGRLTGDRAGEHTRRENA